MTAHHVGEPVTRVRARVRELAQLCEARRSARGISLRAAAAEIGCSYTTIMRLETGLIPDLVNAVLITEWLGVSLDILADPNTPKQVLDYGRGWDDCADSVRTAIKRPEPTPPRNPLMLLDHHESAPADDD